MTFPHIRPDLKTAPVCYVSAFSKIRPLSGSFGCSGTRAMLYLTAPLDGDISPFRCEYPPLPPYRLFFSSGLYLFRPNNYNRDQVSFWGELDIER